MWLNDLNADQRRSFLGLAYNVVVSDGLLDPNEELMMAAFRREMGLGDDVEADYTDLTGVDEVFSDRRSRRIAMLNLVHLSYADGAYEIEEECLLRELANAFGVEDGEFALLENWVKRLVSLEQEAKALL
jgi:tellurite resistance protein